MGPSELREIAEDLKLRVVCGKDVADVARALADHLDEHPVPLERYEAVLDRYEELADLRAERNRLKEAWASYREQFHDEVGLREKIEKELDECIAHFEDGIKDDAERVGIDTRGIIGMAIVHTMADRIEILKKERDRWKDGYDELAGAVIDAEKKRDEAQARLREAERMLKAYPDGGSCETVQEYEALKLAWIKRVSAYFASSPAPQGEPTTNELLAGTELVGESEEPRFTVDEFEDEMARVIIDADWSGESYHQALVLIKGVCARLLASRENKETPQQ